MTATTQGPQAQPDPAARRARQLTAMMVTLVTVNYGFWAYIFWSMGREEGDPTQGLVAVFVALSISAAAALRWPARAGWALAALALIGWVMFARQGMAGDAGMPVWATLLLVTAFYFPALALAWLAREMGRAARMG